MFDDYDYKDTSSRIAVRFSQKRDEPMYPWEIAGFLKRFNTVYYKFELLNSICSALKSGINPEDIFIFDHSLPLYERYSELNLISEPVAAKLFYPIGKPIPLKPNVMTYEYNCLYRIFNTVNSFLKKNHISPLGLANISYLYEELQNFGLASAEAKLIEIAYSRADKSYAAAARRGEKKKQFSDDDLKKSLSLYEKQKGVLFSDLSKIIELDDLDLVEISNSRSKADLRISRLLSEFLKVFQNTARPLICARVGNNKIRVLGRALVNKQEQVGLELKEIKKNSPLAALFEGGVAIYQAIQQEKRSREIHELDLEIKQKTLELAEAQLQGQKIMNLGAQIALANELDALISKTDLNAIKDVPSSHVKAQISDAYSHLESSASYVLNNQGLRLNYESVVTIDTAV